MVLQLKKNDIDFYGHEFVKIETATPSMFIYEKQLKYF